MENLNLQYAKALAIYSAENGIDAREFLIWSAEGIDGSKDWNTMSDHELIDVNLEYDEEEGGFSLESLRLQIEAFASGTAI